MTPVKKVEIIADSLELRNLTAALDQAGVSGYTIVKDVVGRGERGVRDGDELTDVFKNCWIITACTEEQLPAVVEGIRPILKKYGGVCLVSDAQWIVH